MTCHQTIITQPTTSDKNLLCPP